MTISNVASLNVLAFVIQFWSRNGSDWFSKYNANVMIKSKIIKIRGNDETKTYPQNNVKNQPCAPQLIQQFANDWQQPPQHKSSSFLFFLIDLRGSTRRPFFQPNIVQVLFSLTHLTHSAS